MKGAKTAIVIVLVLPPCFVPKSREDEEEKEDEDD